MQLLKDKGGNVIQAFIPDPEKSQVTTSMTGTLVFKKNPTAEETASGVLNITDWLAMFVYPAAASTYHYNEDTTKTFILPAEQTSTIFVNYGNISKVTIAFGAGTNYVQGM